MRLCAVGRQVQIRVGEVSGLGWAKVAGGVLGGGGGRKLKVETDRVEGRPKSSVQVDERPAPQAVFWESECGGHRPGV